MTEKRFTLWWESIGHRGPGIKRIIIIPIFYTLIKGAEISKQHYVRMIGFIPGKVFDEVESTPALLQSIGQTLGQVRNAWQVSMICICDRFA